jgi:hypothetical protein
MMSAHIQPDERLAARYQTRQPRALPVAFSSALILVVALIVAGLPLLVSAGLWLLGMALVLITYAFVSHHRFAIPLWDTAIVGQIAGFSGILLLFLAAII